MSAFRLTRIGSIGPITLVLALFPSLAHAQAPTDAAPAAAESEPAAPVAPAPAPVAAPPAAEAPATPAPAPTKTASTEDTKADAEAEAAAAAAATEASSAHATADDSDQVKLNLYGFTDFTYSTTVGPKFDFASPYSTFAVGKLNLYAAAELGSGWRSLAEIRFMYLPNGTTPASSDPTVIPPRTNTTVADYTDLGRPVRWGGISIERAWLEHTFLPELTVRVGAFLTPYGIWNVDHGSPAIVGVRRPFIVGEALFPEHQTGVEAYGNFNFGPSQIGYHLTLSNGRGPIDTYQDLDHNKAVGGRLFFKHDNSKFGTLTVGTSLYKGTYTDASDVWAPDATGKFVLTHPINAQYKEFALAADLKYELGGLLVQSEAITQQVAYPDNLRPAVFPVAGGPPGWAADYRKIGVYGLAGYRFDFLGIMPFFGGEYYDIGQYTFTPAASAIWGGFNVRPIARVVLKAQYTHSWFSKWQGPELGNFNGIDLQAAWSF
jgi:hypothetical protein